ncbi:MAG TPA: DUF4097 family beta strand repeat-containing protein [Vicinamibacterales bacterium]|nr:DUF4097 family beta strand repeat-containing protein [Vicinamibacterales bacterium]
MSPATLTGAVRGVGLAAILVSAAGCTVQIDGHTFIEREEKRFATGETPEVTLTTFDGSIRVRAWDRSDVLVDVEKRGSDKDAVAAIQVAAEAAGDRISVEARRPASEKRFVGIGLHHSTSARLVASVPRGARLIVTTRDGSIAVERVDGRLELRTDDGSVRVSEAAGDLLVVTRDGSITLERVSGRVDARTGDGGIRVTGAPPALLLDTRDGSIVVRADRGAVIEDDWSLRTGDGSVVVELPQDFNAEIDAETKDGSVRTEFTIAGAGERDRREARRVLRGRLGAGGKLLRVRTNDGSIRLRTS